MLNNILNFGQLDEDELEYKQKMDEKIIGWMRKSYRNNALDMKVQSEKDIICILLDIILYQDAILVNSAFTLLARYYS